MITCCCHCSLCLLCSSVCLMWPGSSCVFCGLDCFFAHGVGQRNGTMRCDVHAIAIARGASDRRRGEFRFGRQCDVDLVCQSLDRGSFEETSQTNLDTKSLR